MSNDNLPRCDLREFNTAPQGEIRKFRLAILVSHPIQYFSPLYRRLAKEPRIDLTVYYCHKPNADNSFDPGFGQKVEWDVPLFDGHRHVFLSNLRKTIGLDAFTSLINPSIISEIFRCRYDALWLHGYRYATHVMAIGAARLTDTPLFYRSESTLTYDRVRGRTWLIRSLKRLLLRFFFRHVSAFLTTGTMNAEFYRHYGAPRNRLFLVPYTVDNDFFIDRVAHFRAERDSIRRDMGITPDTVAFLFPAKLIPIKRPLEALYAYSRLRHQKKALLIAGDGKLRKEIEEHVRRDNIPGVHFFGFVNQSELPRIYAISDVLLRFDGATKGDWGLTVNECMASGLAIIASNQIASVVDLVRHGQNGFIVNHDDLQHFTEAMESMAADPEACKAMGMRSSELIRNWSYEQCVEGVLAALAAHGRPN
jgi:glycosyltransferase involved in cell wall biosynthesis